MKPTWWIIVLTLMLTVHMPAKAEGPALCIAHNAIDELGKPGADWDETRGLLDYVQFQINALAYLAPEENVAGLVKLCNESGLKMVIEGGYFDWTSLLDEFTKDNPKGIHDVVREEFPEGVGRLTAEEEVRKSVFLTRNGGVPAVIYMDGPLRRLMAPGEDAGRTDIPGLSLERTVEEIVSYMKAWRDSYPAIKFVAITNFPNWAWKDYPAYKPDRKGHGDYHGAVAALIAGARAAGIPLAGIRADNPYEYAVGTAPLGSALWNPKDVDWLERLLDLERFVKSEGLHFEATMNSSTGGIASAQAFYRETLRFLETYREAGGSPAVYAVHTWYPFPKRLTPEDKPYTLTYLVRAVAQDLAGQSGAALRAELAKPRPQVAHSFLDMVPPTESGGNRHADAMNWGEWSYWLVETVEKPRYVPLVWNGETGAYRGYVNPVNESQPSILADHVERTQMVPQSGQAAVLRWTCWEPGRYRLAGTWWLSSPGNVALSIIVDGRTVLKEPGYTDTSNPGLEFDTVFDGVEGTVVEFNVDANGDPAHDTARLRAAIEKIPGE